MTPRSLIVGGLLALAVSIQLLSCLGVLVSRNSYARLHYIGPSTLLGSTLIAAAVLVRESLSAAGIKALLVALVLLITGPVISHATARAIHTLTSRRQEEP